MSEDENPSVVATEAAYDALRSIAHRSTIAEAAPEVYRMLGNLKLTGPVLAQVLQQLGRGLVRSLEEREVYQDDGSDPAEAVAVVVEHLREAGALAVQLGDQLDAAQSAISHQGYR